MRSEFLRSAENIPRIVGDIRVSRSGTDDIYQPTQLGWINLPKGRLTHGIKVSTVDGSGAVTAVSVTKATISIGASVSVVPMLGCKILPTKYQVYSQEGIIFPIGIPYLPSGMGHTLFYDVPNKCVRV